MVTPCLTPTLLFRVSQTPCYRNAYRHTILYRKLTMRYCKKIHSKIFQKLVQTKVLLPAYEEMKLELFTEVVLTRYLNLMPATIMCIFCKDRGMHCI